MYFCVLRDGEKISGSGFEGLRGDVGWDGRMKAGRWTTGVGVAVDLEGSVLVWSWKVLKSAGVRGGGTTKRWVVELCGAEGVVGTG